jgi:hypothetical protein
VLSGRLGRAVSPIFTIVAVFGIATLAKAAGRGTGRGTISGLPGGGVSLKLAFCCSTDAVFIFSGLMEAV